MGHVGHWPTFENQMKKYKNNLGEPDIKIAGLQIWIHSRQFPDAKDYWDGNWVDVTVHCGEKNSDVWISGNIIHLPELDRFLSSVKNIHKNLKGSAEMPCMEPNLSVEITVKDRRHMKLIVNITPDHLYQEHKFIFDIDQSYLPKLISDCEAALIKYPIKNRDSSLRSE